MVGLSSFWLEDFKSPARVLARVFWSSREKFKRISKQRAEEVEYLKAQLADRDRQYQLLELELEFCRSQQAQANQVPDGAYERPLPGHQFTPRMISLCCELCLIVGFHATPKVLTCVSEAFHLQLKIPSHDAVRNWNFRNGVAILQEPTPADDLIWMIDHSVQLGKQFVLVVLGIRLADVPKDRPLKREDMRVLAVLPTPARTKEEVSKQLQQVIETFGKPLAVVSDGASELREAVASLKDPQCEKCGNPDEPVKPVKPNQCEQCQVICLSDVKHKIASLLKRELGPKESWKEFESHIGTTTASIQQTELDHFMPPRKKLKCRFMNFDRVVDWARDTLQQLQQDVSSAQLNAKLGWLRKYTAELEQWQQVRDMISTVLRQANYQGVWMGATEQLRQELLLLPATSDWVVKIREALLGIVSANESLLKEIPIQSVRLPCSTEVLESAFGAFKALQRHHNRGTFTALLATFPTLFDTCTPEKIRSRLSRVSNKTLNDWIETSGLSNSTQSRRMKMKSKRPKTQTIPILNTVS